MPNDSSALTPRRPIASYLERIEALERDLREDGHGIAEYLASMLRLELEKMAHGINGSGRPEE